MKIFQLFVLIVFALLLSACAKEKSPTTSDTPPVSLLEVTQLLTSTEDKFIGFGQPSGTTPQEALRLTADWLKTQPNINTATIVDDAFIDIRLNSGLSAVFFLDIMDQDSISITRGGGHGGTSVELNAPFKSKYIIENKRVLLCYPILEEFYKEDEVKNIVARLQSSELGLEITKKEYFEVNSELISTFGNYGLVIINTHGFKDCFLSGSKINFYGDETEAEVKLNVITYLGQKTYDDLTAGLLRFGAQVRTSSGPDWVKNYAGKYGGFTIWIGSEYIRSLPDMPKTIIFGNFCYSGQTNPTKEYPDPIGAAFENKKLISYYGYHDGKGDAYRVSNLFAKAMEDSLTKSLLFDIDSTGNSHLSYKGDEFKDPYYPGYLKQNGAKDYSYKKCGEDFTDPRDGNKYKTVCVGDKVWMAENVRYNSSGSVVYNDSVIYESTYGRLYDWLSVVNEDVCPAGWHLPTNAEWQELIDANGGTLVAGKALKSASGWEFNGSGTNSSGFNALPAGYWDWALNKFNNSGRTTIFWSADDFDPQYRAYYLLLNYSGDQAQLAYSYKTSKGSCRCVKDK